MILSHYKMYMRYNPKYAKIDVVWDGKVSGILLYRWTNENIKTKTKRIYTYDMDMEVGQKTTIMNVFLIIGTLDFHATFEKMGQVKKRKIEFLI